MGGEFPIVADEHPNELEFNRPATEFVLRIHAGSPKEGAHGGAQSVDPSQPSLARPRASRTHAGDDAISDAEIGCRFPGTIEDQQLVLDEHRFSHHSPRTAGTGESGGRRQEMEKQDGQVAPVTMRTKIAKSKKCSWILQFTRHRRSSSAGARGDFGRTQLSKELLCPPIGWREADGVLQMSDCVSILAILSQDLSQ